MPSATASSGPVDPIGQLSNEIQDMIFSRLGWESRAFIYQRSTSASALQAAYAEFCRGALRPTPIQFDDFLVGHCPDAIIRQQLRRPRLLLEPILWGYINPVFIRELTLAVPEYRFSHSNGFRSNGVPTPLMAVDWDHAVVRALLRRLPRVETLRLHGQWITRVYSSEIPYAREWRSVPTPIPSSVKRLYVTEPQCLDPNAWAWRTNDEFALHEVHSCVLSSFTGFDHIEYLHISTAETRWRHIFTCLPRFTSLETLSISCPTGVVLSYHTMEEFLGSLRLLPHLRALDLRYPPGSCAWGIHFRWPALIPQVTKVRIPFMAFDEAFEATLPSDNISFELLIDRPQALGHLRSESEDEFTLDHTPTDRSYDRVIRRVEGVAYWLENKRMPDRRRVEIVECVWEESKWGHCWFEEEEDVWAFDAELEAKMKSGS